MTSGLIVQVLLEAARVLGLGGEGPKEAIFSYEGPLDNRVEIYNLLSSETVNLDELPQNLKLTRSDVVELDRRFKTLWQRCWRPRILFRNQRGIGVNLMARLSRESGSLLQSIVERLDLSYEPEELLSGKGIMQIVLDIADLFGGHMDTPNYLYLNFQQGCADGSLPLGSSFVDAVSVVEGKLSPIIDRLRQLSMDIWRLALEEEVIMADGPLVIKVDLEAELSPDLEALCQQLIELLVVNDQASESDESPAGSSGPPVIEGVLELPDPTTEEIQDQSGLLAFSPPQGIGLS